MSNDPQPSPPVIAYAGADPRAVDASHLSVLSICHFVCGGLLALFSCFGLVYVGLGIAMMAGRMPATSGPPQPVDERYIGIFLTGFGALFLLIGWSMAGCTIASGVCIRRRTKRLFSIIIAALNCAIFPFGTALGVFTLIVLMRESVRQAYQERRQ